MLRWNDSILLSKVTSSSKVVLIITIATIFITCLNFSYAIGGFLASILLFSLIMSVGFLTFGGSSLGFVLNNYSGKDFLATAARLAIGE